MNIWTVLPVKSLAQTKSRLSGVLSLEERAALTLHLLERTLGLLPLVAGLGETAVITQDPVVTQIATQFGCQTLAERPGNGLNGAVTAGVALAAQHGASHCLVLPSDLPFLQVDELAELVALAATAVAHPTVILCSDRQQQGTNGLVVPTDVEFRFGYGRRSFQHHQQEASRLGLAIHLLALPGFQVDLDTEDDYAFYAKNRCPTPS